MPATPDPLSHPGLPREQESGDPLPALLSPALGKFETLLQIA